MQGFQAGVKVEQPRHLLHELLLPLPLIFRRIFVYVHQCSHDGAVQRSMSPYFDRGFLKEAVCGGFFSLARDICVPSSILLAVKTSASSSGLGSWKKVAISDTRRRPSAAIVREGTVEPYLED